LRPIFEPILWFQKPYEIGGTIADNVLMYGVGAWNESALSEYNIEAYEDISFTNILSVTSEKYDIGLHETQKPLKLMECLVSLVTLEGAIVLDPFAGSGTTCLAAKNLNRHYIGIENDTNYVEIARKRMDEAVFQLQINSF